MSDEGPRTETFTERLVAYLDGELPESQVRDVEQTLASDPAVRAEVEKLNRAWELLDLLPQPRASEEFTSRTITAMQAAAADVELAPTEALPSQRARSTVQLTAWTAAVVLVAVLSFVAARRASRPPADPILDDLTLIENLPVYSELGDVQFLKELHKRGLLDEPHPETH